MTAVELDRAVTLPWLLKRAAVRTWGELPRAIGASAIIAASLVPAVIAGLTAQWWLVAMATLPASLSLTGLARFAAIVQRGDRPRLRDAVAVDPVLAVTITLVGTATWGLLSLPELRVAGCLVAAAALILVPYALSYGAVRARPGLAAWRGAVILTAYRPSWALTVLAVTLLGGFAIVASAGALGLVVPVILAVFSAGAVSHLLDVVDSQAGR
ncbi:hypothetical protein BH09ACT5_BH09ACT5_03510 [soil metagenome]